jgi:hypothetical protein
LISKTWCFIQSNQMKLKNFLNSNSLQTVLTLLVTSLCDYILTLVCLVIESTSFKIKYKQLDKRGNQVLKLILK